MMPRSDSHSNVDERHFISYSQMDKNTQLQNILAMPPSNILYLIFKKKQKTHNTFYEIKTKKKRKE